MSKTIKIAVDAMGGDGSPKKIIEGIYHHFKNNKNTFYQIFGDKGQIENFITDELPSGNFEIVHTEDVVKGTDSPLEGAKRGKKTSMWLAIQSVKEKKSDVVISAGNTGALLVISKLNLKMAPRPPRRGGATNSPCGSNRQLLRNRSLRQRPERLNDIRMKRIGQHNIGAKRMNRKRTGCVQAEELHAPFNERVKFHIPHELI